MTKTTDLSSSIGIFSAAETLKDKSMKAMHSLYLVLEYLQILDIGERIVLLGIVNHTLTVIKTDNFCKVGLQNLYRLSRTATDVNGHFKFKST